ncbi:GNAT family N-acetyltransferase [Patescibacteria group bacterium]
MFKIRLLRKNDIDDLARVFYEAFVQDYGHKWTVEEMAKTLTYFHSQQPDLFFIALLGNEIVGGIWGKIVPWRGGLHLKETDMAVSSKHRKKGISKKLLSKIIRKAIDKYNIVEFSGIAHGKRKFPMNYYKRIGLRITDWIFIYGDPNDILKKLER